jgi:hypothetical protein
LNPPSSRARLKRRAIEWTKRFRELILNDRTDLVVRETDPRVIVRLDGTRPDKQHDDVLDRSVLDDCIVAIALAIRPHYGTATVAVFSDDLRPLRKARHVGLDVIEIPEDWRREPEQTEEDKDREKLEQQVAQLRRQEPELVLSTFVVETPIEKILPAYEPLSDNELDELIDGIRQLNPIETNFERAKQRTNEAVIQHVGRGVFQRQFYPAKQEDISRYIENDYPNWIENCRERLAEAHRFLGLPDYGLRLRVKLSNHGTRPALDLQLSFRANGSIGIMPNDRDEAEDEASWFTEHVASGFSLAEAPSAPQGEWRTVGPLASIMGLRDHNLDYPLPIYDRPTFQDVLRGQRRDRNRFYFRDRPREPVSGYSVVCEQFRHADEERNFDILMWPLGDIQALDGKNAVVEVIANASNLTAPETLKIRIRFRCEERSTYQAVQKHIFPGRTAP